MKLLHINNKNRNMLKFLKIKLYCIQITYWNQLQVAIITTVSSKNLQKRSYDNLDGSRASNHATNFHNIHDTQFCTDVSSWGPVEWVGEQTRKCNTTFVKEKKERSETVCIKQSNMSRMFRGPWFLSIYHSNIRHVISL